MTGLRGLGACGTFHDTPLICTWVQLRCCSVQYTPWRPRWPSFMSDYFHVHCRDITVPCGHLVGQMLCLCDGLVAGNRSCNKFSWNCNNGSTDKCSWMRSPIFRLNMTRMVVCLFFFQMHSIVWMHWFFRLSCLSLTKVMSQTVTAERFRLALSWNVTTDWRRVCHFVHCAGDWRGGLPSQITGCCPKSAAHCRIAPGQQIRDSKGQ